MLASIQVYIHFIGGMPSVSYDEDQMSSSEM